MYALKRTFIAPAIAIMIGASLLFGGVAPPASAQTAVDLQLMINQLLAQIASLQAQLAGYGAGTTAVVCPYTWTRDLGVGASGTDVMRLQQFLNADPATRIAGIGMGSPGQESQYYGALTADAVARFQSKYRNEVLLPLGLVNPTGYFGSATRAKANALCVTPPQPQPQPVPPPTPPQNGDNALRAREAMIQQFSLRSGDDTDLTENQRNASIADLQFEVEDGDVRVSRLDLVFEPNVGNDQRNPWNTFTNVSIWDGNTLVAERRADVRSNWAANTPSSGQYRIRLPDFNLVYRQGERAELTVRVSVVPTVRGADDGETWLLFVPEQGIRAQDGLNISHLFGNPNFNVSFDIEREGINDQLKVRNTADDPVASTFELSASARSDWKHVFTFRLDSDSSRNDIEILTLPITMNTSSSTYNTLVDSIELRINGDRYTRSTVTGGATDSATISFDLGYDEFVIGAGDAEDVEVWVRFRALTPANEGVTFTMSTNADSIVAEGAERLTVAQKSGSATSETHTLRTTGVNIRIESATVQTVNIPADPSASYGVYRMRIHVTAIGDTIFVPLTALRGSAITHGVAYRIEDSSGNVIADGHTSESLTRISGGTLAGDYVRIEEDLTATLELLATFDPAAIGQYRLQILSIGFNTTAAPPNDSQAALPAQNFRTGFTFITN